MNRFKVTGNAAIVGSDGRDVHPGGIVEFADDTPINVRALVEGGHLVPVDEKPAGKPKGAESKDG